MEEYLSKNTGRSLEYQGILSRWSRGVRTFHVRNCPIYRVLASVVHNPGLGIGIPPSEPDNDRHTRFLSVSKNTGRSLEYLVRGATLECRMGSVPRKLNLLQDHGVYITDKPVVHRLNCDPGEGMNISKRLPHPLSSHTYCLVRPFLASFYRYLLAWKAATASGKRNWAARRISPGSIGTNRTFRPSSRVYGLPSSERCFFKASDAFLCASSRSVLWFGVPDLAFGPFTSRIGNPQR